MDFIHYEDHTFHESCHMPVSGTGGKFGVMPISSGHLVSRHHVVHRRTMDDWLIMYCLSGKGWGSVGKKRVDICAGDIFVTQPGIVHSYAADEHVGWEVAWMHVGGMACANMISLCGFSPENIVMYMGIDEDLIDYFLRILALLRRKPVHCETDASVALYSLLAEIHKKSQTTQTQKSGIDMAVISTATSVDDMARLSNMSKFHFIRKFKQLTGMTPGRFIISKRIARAKDLLGRPQLSIKQIAGRLEMSDPDYFCRFFKKETKMSPGEFRKTLGSV